MMSLVPRYTLVTFFVCLFCVSATRAATITSTATGGLWNAPSTWVGGVVPAAGDNVTIASGATVTLNVTPLYTHTGTITVNGTLRLATNLKISGTNAKLIVNTNGKVIEDTTDYKTSSNRSLTIDAGSGSGNGSSAVFSNPGLSVSGVVEVSNLILNKDSWSVISSTGTKTYGGTVYVKTMFYSDTQSNMKIDGLLVVALGGIWDTGNNGSNIVTSGNGVFSVQGTDDSGNYDPTVQYYCASYPCGSSCAAQVCSRVQSSGYDYPVPQPVTLVSFSAAYQHDEQRVSLEWVTAMEINNAGFTVERSADALHFEGITRVPGAGNSREKRMYLAYDENPLEDIAYYRLKQTDLDGTTAYSKVVAVYPGDAGSFGLEILPNPFNGRELSLQFAGGDGAASVTVYNSLGECMYGSSSVPGPARELHLRLGKPLSAGMYWLRVIRDNQVYTRQVWVDNQ